MRDSGGFGTIIKLDSINYLIWKSSV